MKDLKKIRKKIDKVDGGLIKSFVKRMELVEQVAEEKRKSGKPIVDSEREKEIVERLSKKVPDKYNEYVNDLYGTLFGISKDYERKKNPHGKYCLIGEKLSHSFSAEIHNANGFDYSLREIKESDLEKFVKDNCYDGFNVTIPYKEKIIPFLDTVDTDALEIGSVNTVKKVGDKTYGFNTDLIGMEKVFSDNKIKLNGKSVAVLGSGGTSKTAVYLCKKNHAREINVVSRTGDINYGNYIEKLKGCEILINATPVGMFPNSFERLIDLSKLPNLKFVFDCVYNPLKTMLILQAEELKIKCEGGLDMLYRQAVASEYIWEGRSNGVFNKEIAKLKREKSNIVLYGMPSSGKTTLGKAVSKELGRQFFDSDEEFTKTFAVLPCEFIEKYGEKAFREKEKEIIKTLSLKSGCVIAVGGGSVLNKENVLYLKQNGILIQIKRKIKELSEENRPILKNEGAKNLYLKRKSIYNKISNLYIHNNNNINDSEKRIIKIYENTRY